MDWTGKVRSDVISGNLLFDAAIACAMVAGVRVCGEEELSVMLVPRRSSMRGSGAGQGPQRKLGIKHWRETKRRKCPAIQACVFPREWCGK